MRGKFTLFLVFLALLGTANAECEGSISVTDLGDNLQLDYQYPILVTTTISPALGFRTIDLFISDPLGNRITPLYAYYMSNSTYAFSLSFNTSSSLITGNYKIYARISVYDTGNLANKVCDEEKFEEFYLSTNRTRYGGETVVITILPNYQVLRQNYRICDNISLINSDNTSNIEEFPICVDMKSVPADLQIGIKRIVMVNTSQYNITNASIEIFGNESLLPFSFVNALVRFYGNQSSDLSGMREEMVAMRENYQSVISNLQSQNYDLIRQNQNLSATMAGKFQDEILFGFSHEFLKGILLGIIALALLLTYISKQAKKKKTE